MTRRRTPLPHRRLVLDASAAGALRSTALRDQRRAAVLLAITAADSGVSVPTSVRVEVAWDRRSAAWSSANRLVREDDVLDARVADRHVAVAAHLHAVAHGTGTVEVLTSDVTDVRSVLDALPRGPGAIDVRRL